MFCKVPGQVQAVRDTGQVIDQSFLKKEPYDIVHAIMLRLRCCRAIETGCWRTRLHDGANDAHDSLKSGGVENIFWNSSISQFNSNNINNWAEFFQLLLHLPGMFFCAFRHCECSTEGSLHFVDQGHLSICACASSCQASQEKTRQGRSVLVFRILGVRQQVVKHEGKNTAIL